MTNDPPMWGAKELTSELTKNKILISSPVRWGEENYSTVEEWFEKTIRVTEIQIYPKGMVVLNNSAEEYLFSCCISKTLWNNKISKFVYLGFPLK